MAAAADLLVPIVQERTVLARSRRIPLLKRGTTRIRRHDALVRKIGVWISRFLHSVEIYEVKCSSALVPLDLAILVQTIALSQHARDNALAVLHPDATHALDVVAEKDLARRAP